MRSKYGNRRTSVNGITFDSAAEAGRYRELLLRLRAGDIQNLKLQPQFTLQEGFKTIDGEIVRPTVYRADFSYIEDGRTVVEDVKGVETDVFKLKAKLLLERHGIKIRVVSA